MSRMTLLHGEIWLGSGPESGLPRFVRAPEAGYPPYNVELLPEGDGTRGTLRITLAVAGFSVDELAVTVEGGQLIVRGKQRRTRARLSLPGYRRAALQAELRPRQRRRGAEAELHDGLLAIELDRPLPSAGDGRCGSPTAGRPRRGEWH